MNKDMVIEGKYTEMHGQFKEWWVKLTDNELDMADGNAKRIIGLLQMKYGYTRQRAEREFKQKIAQVKENIS